MSGDLEPLRVFSFGGGVQSVAALVLAAAGRIPYRTFVFANVGDDSEFPATMAYLREVARPYAELHGLEVVETARVKRDGTTETLLGRMTREGSRSIPIPVYFRPDGPPGARTCTGEFKVEIVRRWLRAQGCGPQGRGKKAVPGRRAVTGIGISTDEAIRMKNGSGVDWQDLDYPLIDLLVSRDDCKRIIREAGLPVPPKSACWFCPFHRKASWQDMYDNQRHLFDAAVALERRLNEGRGVPGKDRVYLTRTGRPLDEVIDGSHQDQLGLFASEGVEQHNCAPFACTTGFAAEG